ncbi:MAG: GNAT family N-acetyltransferase [Roseburia sp.]|nr:GNAT family N-acetyltransferase [Roseburia sp.]
MSFQVIHLPNGEQKNPCSWGVVENGEVIARIETLQPETENVLRITELFTAEAYRRQGMGHALLAVAKKQAAFERRSGIVIEIPCEEETAEAFFQKEGFCPAGEPQNNAAEEKSETGKKTRKWSYSPKRKKILKPEEVEIRKELPEEYHKTERVAQEAFWNLHHPGCNEHYLVHKLRDSSDYLPELSRIALVDGEIVGTIMYSKAVVREGEKETPLLTFGPLCVKPEWQGCGIGKLLLKETMKLAAQAGYSGIVIFGEPEYYPKAGFVTCDHFGITTADGANFDAFMGIELLPGAMEGIHGKFYESEVFEHLPDAEVEAFSREFPPLEKQYFPGQWD